MMNVTETEIPDIKIIDIDVFPDERGFLCETYQENKYIGKGITEKFVQDNQSFSKKHVIRGLHFQQRHPQGKLIMAVAGEVFDVAVDIRIKSPTYGKWVGVSLSDKNQRQLYIPEGFAHGFCVVSDYAIVHYKCTNFYDPADNRGLIWSDPDIKIGWPTKNPLVSSRDKQLPTLKEYMAG